jgi:teichuronic acid biosynthesis glycosyltransferase TuaC
MKVTFLCSGTRGILSPFIKEQMDSLKALGVEISLSQISRKGWLGYFIHIFKLNRTLCRVRPDLIHAHYGLCGLIGNIQNKAPVITTFHGSDINDPKILKWSKFAHRLSSASIFVDSAMLSKMKNHHKSEVIPCGVDLEIFYEISKKSARHQLNLEENCKYVLFSSDFYNPVKNYPLARLVCDTVEKKTGIKIKLIELKGMSRETVNLHINASDFVLLLSSSEGSPQIIKEAMACNCPIVATNVGDIKFILGNTTGCYISSTNVEELHGRIIMALNFSQEIGKTTGRQRIVELGLDNISIAKRIEKLYSSIIG